MTLLLAALACGAVAAAATLGNRLDSGAAAAQFKLPDPAARALMRPAVPAADPIQVVSPTRAELAEMTRRLGTPRRCRTRVSCPAAR